MRLSYLSLFFALLLTGCISQYDYRGYQEFEQLATVRPQVTTRTSLIEAVGTPTLTSQYGPLTYYYVGQKVKTTAFFRPKIAEQKVAAITFDAAQHFVTDLRIYSLEHGKPTLVFDRAHTKTRGDDTGVILDLFSNIGKFNLQ